VRHADPHSLHFCQGRAKSARNVLGQHGGSAPFATSTMFTTNVLGPAWWQRPPCSTRLFEMWRPSRSTAASRTDTASSLSAAHTCVHADHVRVHAVSVHVCVRVRAHMATMCVLPPGRTLRRRSARRTPVFMQSTRAQALRHCSAMQQSMCLTMDFLSKDR